ncbi:DUF2460 domain-containing protein [Colibacter massiliensis]|uniref:DUF2460 domain-containing protein n=1 Tax=Colibacter massiliensis TaxID=1852379 RepID=UPI003F93437B
MAELKKFPNIKSLAWKSTKAQKWDTKTKRSGSGKVRTMTTWRYPQYTITTNFAYLTPDQYREIMGFFATVKGGTEPFLWLDPEDYEEKGIVLGKGSAKEWQAFRKFGNFVEPVYYIEAVKLYADNAPVTNITVDKGIIRTTDILSADAVITADYTYWWKVVLSGDFTAELVYTNVYKSKSMKLVTVQ